MLKKKRIAIWGTCIAVLVAAVFVIATLIPEKEVYASYVYSEISLNTSMVTESSTPWNNCSNVASYVVDGNTSTFFDGVNNGYLIIDMGAKHKVGGFAFYPRAGYESRGVGGTFYGSNNKSSWTQLYTITSTPSASYNYYYDLNTVSDYRYIKYATTTDCCNVAEIKVLEATEGGSADIGFALNLFCQSTTGPANNVAMNWGTSLTASSYKVYRSTNASSGFSLIYNGDGVSCQDYDLNVGTTYYYKLVVVNGSSETQSTVKAITPVNVNSSNMHIYDNQVGSNIVYEKSGTLINGVYYLWGTAGDGGEGVYFWEKTSTDGVNFSAERVILNSQNASSLASCKLEAINIEYVPSLGKVVIWAHWEAYGTGYGDGKAFVATGNAGGNFTYYHCYNPLDIYVRDMSVFVDDDGTGYLVAASNVAGEGANATIRIFRMNTGMNDIEAVVATVHPNQYREAPHIVIIDGYYYMVSSQAAGWYPSSGAYASCSSVDGNWSDAIPIGNTSTFSAQSGWLWKCGDTYIMHAYRWIRGDGTSGTSLLPMSFDNGYAFYDYYPYLLYNNETGEFYPVQLGENVSQGKNVTASDACSAGNDAGNLVDGNYYSYYAGTSSSDWPVSFTMDLGAVYDLTNIQLSWFIYKGSEGYYTYTVETSYDNQVWTTVLDRMNTNDTVVNKTYGFSSNLMSGQGRYVRVYVERAYLQNNPNNWYTPTVYEIKVFGDVASDQTKDDYTKIVEYDFNETLKGAKVNDLSRNGYDGTIYGNATYVTDSTKGQVLYLNGTSNTYVQFPTGIFDGKNDMTISMDVKSASTGNFFTWAIGQNSTKYFFTKMATNSVRYAISTNAWGGETGLSYNLTGNAWHNYTATLSGSTMKLYVDGVLVSTSTNIGTSISALGNNLIGYIGKSFYDGDAYFNGYIDNVRIYSEAMTASKVSSLVNNTSPVMNLKFNETLSGKTAVNSGTSPYGGYLFGNATYANDSAKGKVLYLDGSAGTYMQLPTGLLDNANEVTISMDVKSASTGNFFTFAVGQDNNKYFFTKTSTANTRYAITTSTYSAETGDTYTLTGSSWHKYTYVITHNSLKLYVDGTLVQTATLGDCMTDLGDSLTILVGKSFYNGDAYFNGYIDNLAIYDYAMTASQVSGL